MSFSRRTSWDTMESDWAKLLRERRESNLPTLDLTASNPTRCGFDYDSTQILRPLADPAAMDYNPDPHGMLSAREAICQYYRDHAAAVTPDQIFLTTSTSEAYSFLFRLLCDPGDEILIAQPSYPLFDFLAVLDDVEVVAYPLFYDYGWHVDFETLRQRITPRTRAIVVVNPNNPTGHFTGVIEREQLEAICLEHHLALIVDEVFLDYPMDQEKGATFATPPHSVSSNIDFPHKVVTFILSGMSKISAIPQMKASWIVCLGQPADRAEVISRLEVIADTFLSMNAPVQHALPVWLSAREAIQTQIRKRIAENLAALDTRLARQPAITRLNVEAGWSTVLRIPAVRSDEETVLALLRDHGVAVHAGSLYGFESSGWVVISLLTPTLVFVAGLERIINEVNNLQ
jgi:alanine-synthesizing transaminase